MLPWHPYTTVMPTVTLFIRLKYLGGPLPPQTSLYDQTDWVNFRAPFISRGVLTASKDKGCTQIQRNGTGGGGRASDTFRYLSFMNVVLLGITGTCKVLP